MSKFAYFASRGKKFIAAIVGAIVGAGGVAVLFPSLPATWQATITGLVTVLAVVLGPANAPKAP